MCGFHPRETVFSLSSARAISDTDVRLVGQGRLAIFYPLLYLRGFSLLKWNLRSHYLLLFFFALERRAFAFRPITPAFIRQISEQRPSFSHWTFTFSLHPQ
jgi:hypothetical protein